MAGGREKRMSGRWSLFISPEIPELLLRLIKLRKATKNYTPTKADVLREAMIIGLQKMIENEEKTYDEQRDR